jgi:hypothetical protein
MDVDIAIGEIAKDAAAEADKIAADEDAKTAQDKATKETMEGTGQGTDDHTDGIRPQERQALHQPRSPLPLVR